MLIQLRNYEIPNEAIGLYLTSSLYKAIASTHDWNYKAGWNRIKKDIVSLPIKIDENGNPIIDDTHFYHDEGEELAEVGLDVNDRFEFMLRTKGYCGNNNLYIGRTPTDITTDKEFL